MAEQAQAVVGKVCLVTGATQGIGRETALGLARLGARVAIVGRDRKRTDAAAEYVRAGAVGSAVDVFVADLSSLAEVRRLAAEVQQRLPALQVLVNNAGGLFMQRETTADGLERTFALNHLGYFLLTNLLLGMLRKSAPARVVNVASDAHKGARKGLDFADLQGERHYKGLDAYCKSKLANILFTRELARRLEGTGVTANSLHPGLIASGFALNNRGLLGVGWKLMGLFLTKPAKGARTSIYAASSPVLEKVSGKYLKDRKPVSPTAAAQDDKAAVKLWSESARLTGLAG